MEVAKLWSKLCSPIFNLQYGRLSLDPLIFFSWKNEVLGLRGEIRDMVKDVLQSGVSWVCIYPPLHTSEVDLTLQTLCVLFYEIEIIFILRIILDVR